MALLVLKLTHPVYLFLPLLHLLFKFLSPLDDLQLLILTIVILSLKPSSFKWNEDKAILLLSFSQFFLVLSYPSIDLHFAIVTFISLVFFLNFEHVLLLDVMELQLHFCHFLAVEVVKLVSILVKMLLFFILDVHVDLMHLLSRVV